MSIFTDYATEFFTSDLHTQYKEDTILPLFALFYQTQDKNYSDPSYVNLLWDMLTRGMELHFDVTAIYEFTMELNDRIIRMHPEVDIPISTVSEKIDDLVSVYHTEIEKTGIPYRTWSMSEFLAEVNTSSFMDNCKITN